MDKLSDFIAKPETQKLINKTTKRIITYEMNRDVFRPLYYDKNVMYSPADGFVIYSEVVKPNEDIIDVKGGKYTVNTLLREEIKEQCLVIGIFMTCIDIHVNKVPTNAFVSYEKLPCLKVQNLSMRPVEKTIFEQLNLDTNVMKYAYYNEAMKNKLFVPYLNQHYWIVQIADFEVDTIVPFRAQNAFFTQGERFSLVRFGSQVDLIIPLKNNGVKFKSFIPSDGEIYHVSVGIDKLVEIKR